MKGLINALSPAGDTVATTLTMSSREIAELTDKRHDNVLRDIRAMLTELYGAGGVLKFEHTHTNLQNGQSYPIFSLPKDLTLTLVAGYNVKLRKRIIDRWMELEAQAQQPDVTATLADPASLRGLLLTYTEKVLALEATVAEQAPKVEVYDRIAEDTGTYLIRRAAKALGIGPGKFVDWMLANGWAYRHNGKGHLLGYQDKLDKGWLAHKLTPFWNKRTGREDIGASLRVTSKGITELAKKVPALRAA